MAGNITVSGGRRVQANAATPLVIHQLTGAYCVGWCTICENTYVQSVSARVIIIHEPQKYVFNSYTQKKKREWSNHFRLTMFLFTTTISYNKRGADFLFCLRARFRVLVEVRPKDLYHTHYFNYSGRLLLFLSWLKHAPTIISINVITVSACRPSLDGLQLNRRPDSRLLLCSL